jgi:HK97 family phage major capsid protein
LGRPVIEAVDMPSVAANAFPVIYGDFSGYQIYDRLALSILQDPYSQATSQKTRYHATRMVGGAVKRPSFFRKMKVAVS